MTLRTRAAGALLLSLESNRRLPTTTLLLNRPCGGGGGGGGGAVDIVVKRALDEDKEKEILASLEAGSLGEPDPEGK